MAKKHNAPKRKPKRNPEWERAGRRLYQQRINLGLTQVEFAERIGVAANTVARWERGEIGMHPLRAANIETVCQNTDLTENRRKNG